MNFKTKTLNMITKEQLLAPPIDIERLQQLEDDLSVRAWFNHHRLMESLGYIPPAEAEANYYRQLETAAAEPALT